MNDSSKRRSQFSHWFLFSKVGKLDKLVIEAGRQFQMPGSLVKNLEFLFPFNQYAKNIIVVYSVLRNWPIETCWLRNSCMVYERKATVVDLPSSNLNLGIFVRSFDFAGLPNHSPLFTMNKGRERKNCLFFLEQLLSTSNFWLSSSNF